MQTLRHDKMNKSSFSASSSSSSSLSSSNFSLPQSDNHNQSNATITNTNANAPSTNNHQNFLGDKIVKKTNRVKDASSATLTSIDNFIEENSSTGIFCLCKI